MEENEKMNNNVKYLYNLEYTYCRSRHIKHVRYGVPEVNYVLIIVEGQMNTYCATFGAPSSASVKIPGKKWVTAFFHMATRQASNSKMARERGPTSWTYW